MKHTWIKEGKSRWRCITCGMVKEVSVEPRTEKFVYGKSTTTFSLNGHVFDNNPGCKL